MSLYEPSVYLRFALFVSSALSLPMSFRSLIWDDGINQGLSQVAQQQHLSMCSLYLYS